MQQSNGSEVSPAISDTPDRDICSAAVAAGSATSCHCSREKPASRRSGDGAAAHDGLSSEVLAMCGIDSRLWGLNFSEAAKAADGIQHAACPLEGIKCLLVSFLVARQWQEQASKIAYNFALTGAPLLSISCCNM